MISGHGVTSSGMSYWCCAQVDRRRERLALHCLALSGFQTYVPRIRAPQRTSTPLFPSYAFVRIELQWHAVRWSPGVLRLITNGGEGPAHVPDRIIDELRSREGRDGLIALPRSPHPGDRFQRGDKVRVTTGPLTGFVGLVESMRAHQRVEVLLQMLGSLQRVELANRR
jgi:transcription antitermination factor NusG